MFEHEHVVAAHDEGQPPQAAPSLITTTLTPPHPFITTANVAQHAGAVPAPAVGQHCNLPVALRGLLEPCARTTGTHGS